MVVLNKMSKNQNNFNKYMQNWLQIAEHHMIGLNIFSIWRKKLIFPTKMLNDSSNFISSFIRLFRTLNVKILHDVNAHIKCYHKFFQIGTQSDGTTG